MWLLAAILDSAVWVAGKDEDRNVYIWYISFTGMVESWMRVGWSVNKREEANSIISY